MADPRDAVETRHLIGTLRATGFAFQFVVHRLPSTSLTADGVACLPEQRKHSVHVCDVLTVSRRFVQVVVDDGGQDAPQPKVQLGANMSAAAGPKGRDTGASTDASLRAEMLSYSRSRGLFAGVSLEGTSLRPDDDASAEIYGHKVTAQEIVRGTSNAVPDAGRRLVDMLQKKAARNASTAAR
jgi:hypothetical protein